MSGRRSRRRRSQARHRIQRMKEFSQVLVRGGVWSVLFLLLIGSLAGALVMFLAGHIVYAVLLLLLGMVVGTALLKRERAA